MIQQPVPPCGMNSIVYVGDNYATAMHVYNFITGGKDAWNQPNPEYGVGLSLWNPDRREYVTKRWKSA